MVIILIYAIRLGNGRMRNADWVSNVFVRAMTTAVRVVWLAHTYGWAFVECIVIPFANG